MKILMCNRPKEWWVGGDMVQLEATATELRKRGHTVDYSSAATVKPGYDIVHLWHLSMGWSFDQYHSAKRTGATIVCSTIYHDTDSAVTYEAQQDMANGMDALIFLCQGEYDRAAKRINIPYEKAFIIPNGIEEKFFARMPTTESYVLTVGRLAEFKGQQHVAQVCKELGLKYVCIGDGHDDKLLTKMGATVMKAMPRNKLVKWYAMCSVFVLASMAEIFPLSVMEAAAQNKKIILTDTSCWFPENAISCKHGDLDSIKEALLSVPQATPVDVSGYKWSVVGDHLEEVYRCALQS